MAKAKRLTEQQQERFEVELGQAVRQINFCVYHKRRVAGTDYLHEHPSTATSWQLPSMRSIVEHHGNHVATADQCAYGLTTKDPVHAVLPARKPTRFATKSPAIAEALSRRCECRGGPGLSKHGLLIAGRAAAAAIYPDGF